LKNNNDQAFEHCIYVSHFYLLFSLTQYQHFQSAARLFGSSISSKDLISVSGVGCQASSYGLFCFCIKENNDMHFEVVYVHFPVVFACLMMIIALRLTDWHNY